MTRCPLTLSLILACLMAVAAHAHNGVLTVAEPLSGITIDADFSDWPATTRWQAIDVVGVGEPPHDADDLSARFAVGYDAQESVLYVAIEVRDESSVVKRLDDTLLDWSERDRSEIYLVIDHQGTTELPVQFVNAEDGIRGLRIPGGELHDPEGVRCTHVYSNGLHRYEWAIETRRLVLQAGDLVPGQVIGFDVSIVDHDGDGAYSWVSWGGGIVKFQDRFRVGDVVLSGTESLGRLQGVLRRPMSTDSPWYRRDPIDLRRDGSLVATVMADRDGQFRATLPQGSYRAHVRAGGDSVGTPFVADASRSARIELPWMPARGERRAVTLDERTAGTGTWSHDWHTFGSEDGLSGVSVYDIDQAGDGGLWLATTDGGAMHWDGRRLRELSETGGLPHNGVNDLLEDGSGRLWLAMNFVGLAMYEGGMLTRYHQGNVLPDNYISKVMRTRDGALWANSLGGGLMRFDEDGVRHVTSADGLLNNSVAAMAEGPGGELWFGSISGGVNRYDGQVFEHFTAPELRGTVFDIEPGIDGSVWIATSTGLVRLHEGSITVFGGDDSGSPMASPVSLHLDRDGALWVAGRGGLTRYADGRERTFTTADGLPAARVLSVAGDREGNIWAGTQGGGIARYTNSRLDIVAQGQQPRALIQRRDGSLWFGTDEGDVCHSRDGEPWTCWPRSASGITALLEDRRGRLWVGYTPGGLACLDGDRVESFTEADGLPANQVTTLSEDTRGNIWVGTRAGLGRYDGAGFRSFTVADGLHSNAINSIVAGPDGGLWVSTGHPDKPLSYFDGKRFEDRDGLQGYLHQGPDGALWGIQADGLRRRTADTRQLFGRAEGLPTASLLALTTDRDGRPWIGTTAGLFAFDGGVFQLVQGPAAVGGVRTMLQTVAGDWWFGGTQGLARYTPVHAPPPVRLVDVVDSHRRGPITEIEMPATEDLLAIEYYGISFKTRPDRMAYRYRVTGLEDDWRYTREERAELEDLPLGQYVFELQAIDRDLDYSEEPATVRIRVVPAYGIWSLYGAVGLAVVIIAATTKRSVKQRNERDAAKQQLLATTEQRNRALELSNERLREADRLKSDFVSNVSHELRTPLTVIKGSVDNMMDGIVGSFDDQQQDYLDRLKANADRLASLIDDLLDLSRIEAGHLHLLPTDTSVRDVCIGVVDSLRPTAAERHVSLELPTDMASGTAWADPNRVYQVLLNLVNNAIKFTPAGGSVRLTIDHEGGFVRTSVADTGPGVPAEQRERIFDKFHQVGDADSSSRGAGIGLSIARHLVELHGGRIWVEGTEGEGSTFRFTLPQATGETWPES